MLLGIITLKANAISRKHTYWLSFHIYGMKGIRLNDLQCTFYVKIQGKERDSQQRISEGVTEEVTSEQ